MIPKNNMHNIDSTSGITKKSQKYFISQTNEKTIMDILSKHIYANPIGAVVREYYSNALDANKESKSDKKIDIGIIKRSKNYAFFVRDYGPGLEEEEIYKIYNSYGSSTKRNTNEQIGFMGIGSKSGFAYSNIFKIESYKNGTCSTYVSTKGKYDQECKKLSEVKTNKDNGISIEVPIKDKDKDKFAEAIEYYTLFTRDFVDIDISFRTFDVIDMVELVTIDKNSKVLYTNTRLPYKDTGYTVLIGKIPYTIPDEFNGNDYIENEVNTNNLCIRYLFDTDIGEFDISGNREDIKIENFYIDLLKDKYIGAINKKANEYKQLINYHYSNLLDTLLSTIKTNKTSSTDKSTIDIIQELYNNRLNNILPLEHINFYLNLYSPITVDTTVQKTKYKIYMNNLSYYKYTINPDISIKFAIIIDYHNDQKVSSYSVTNNSIDDFTVSYRMSHEAYIDLTVYIHQIIKEIQNKLLIITDKANWRNDYKKFRIENNIKHDDIYVINKKQANDNNPFYRFLYSILGKENILYILKNKKSKNSDSQKRGLRKSDIIEIRNGNYHSRTNFINTKNNVSDLNQLDNKLYIGVEYQGSGNYIQTKNLMYGYNNIGINLSILQYIAKEMYDDISSNIDPANNFFIYGIKSRAEDKPDDSWTRFDSDIVDNIVDMVFNNFTILNPKTLYILYNRYISNNRYNKTFEELNFGIHHIAEYILEQIKNTTIGSALNNFYINYKEMDKKVKAETIIQNLYHMVVCLFTYKPYTESHDSYTIIDNNIDHLLYDEKIIMSIFVTGYMNNYDKSSTYHISNKLFENTLLICNELKDYSCDIKTKIKMYYDNESIKKPDYGIKSLNELMMYNSIKNYIDDIKDFKDYHKKVKKWLDIFNTYIEAIVNDDHYISNRSSTSEIESLIDTFIEMQKDLSCNIKDIYIDLKNISIDLLNSKDTSNRSKKIISDISEEINSSFYAILYITNILIPSYIIKKGQTNV